MKNTLFILAAVISFTTTSQAQTYQKNLSQEQCIQLHREFDDHGEKTANYLMSIFKSNIEVLRAITFVAENNAVKPKDGQEPFQLYFYGQEFNFRNLLAQSALKFHKWTKDLNDADEQVWNFYSKAMIEAPVYFRTLTPEQKTLLLKFKFTFADIVLVSEQIDQWIQTKCTNQVDTTVGTNVDTTVSEEYYQSLLKISGLDQVAEFKK